MEKNYEAPKLTLIGEANDVVMGLGGSGSDGLAHLTAPDFEFEDDWSLI